MKLEKKQEAEKTKTASKQTTVKLPKLDFKKFSGNVLLSYEFGDSFDAAIHSSPCFTAVEIMKYLKVKLNGNAAEVILGITLTNVNYEEAIKLLKERFGQNDIIINTRYTISSWIYLLHPPTQVPYVPTMTK